MHADEQQFFAQEQAAAGDGDKKSDLEASQL